MVQISETGLKWLRRVKQALPSSRKALPTVPDGDVRLDKYVRNYNKPCKPYWFMPSYAIVTIGLLYRKPSGFMYIREASVIVMGNVVKLVSDKLVWVPQSENYYFTLMRRNVRVWKFISVTYPLGQQIVDLVRATFRLKVKPLKAKS